MAKKIRFGIIGCGMISNFHIKAIDQIEDAEIAAFSDVVEERVKEMAGQQNAKPYTNYEKMIEEGDIDAVIVCTPSGMHFEPAVIAAKHKKHVVVEKPMEITLEKCDAIIDACRENKVKLCTIFPGRYHDASQLLKKTIDSGRLGRLTLCDAYCKWWRTQEYYDKGGWKGTWKMDGGGALMNQSIHTIDMLQWLVGDIESVTANMATLAHKNIEVEDVAVASLVFKNGALGTIEGASAVYPGYFRRIELSGDKGSIVQEEEDIKIWDFEEKIPEDEDILVKYGAKTEHGGATSDPSSIGSEGHRRQLVDFIDSIRNDTTSLVGDAEGRKATAIILGIYQSARSGKREKII